jgi:asparagine synthase (glutamine-hydrolysing)
VCGILGGFDAGRKMSEGDWIRLRDLMEYRGPDDGGLYTDADLPVFLAHRRLSIIDLSQAARQPMSDADGMLWLTFNGEIYNFQTLRGELEAQGAVFRSHSDSEVILHGYRVWGEKVVERLQGMFAFCLYDRRKKILFLARDRVGIKPLYYAHRGSDFLFASEIRSIAESPLARKEIDPTALMDFLSFGYVDAPKSVWKGIQKLPAGHAGIFSIDTGEFLSFPYWDFDFRPRDFDSDLSSLKASIQKMLEESVQSHLVSDVPLGAFLSGGLDSSMVVASMVHQSSRPVRTFSIGFHEERFNELPLAQKLSERYGTDHSIEVVDLAKMRESFERVFHYFGEPFADSSSIAMDFLAAMTRKRVTVALSGDGGDELFGGYRRYLKMHYGRILRKIPLGRDVCLFFGSRKNFWEAQKSFTTEMGFSPARAYASACSKMTPDGVKRLLKPEILREAVDYDPFEKTQRLFQSGIDRGFDFWGCMRYVDAKTWLPEDVLTKVDRVTMRHSLEARVPLLDHHFIESVQNIPQEILYGGRDLSPRLKGLFKEIAVPFLPPEHFSQPKRGFGLPIKEWFKDLLYDETSKIGLEESSPFVNGPVKTLLDLHRSGKRSFDEALWTIRVLEHWWRKEIAGV